MCADKNVLEFSKMFEYILVMFKVLKFVPEGGSKGVPQHISNFAYSVIANST